MKKLYLIAVLAVAVAGCCIFGGAKVRQQCNFAESVCADNLQALQNGIEKFYAKGGAYIIKDMDSGKILENTAINFNTNAVYETYFLKINFENKTTPEKLLNKYINLVRISGKSLHRKLRENVVEGTGRKANVKDAEVSGITATTQKGSAEVVITTFLGHFTHNGKIYAFIFVLDEPKGLKQTYGWQSAGWNVVPTTGNIIENIIK